MNIAISRLSGYLGNLNENKSKRVNVISSKKS
jgi:hypothetical protein